MEKNRISTVIIDDEKSATDILELRLSRHPQLEITGIFNDPLKASDEIPGLNPDLMFLDIQMPELNGFQLLHQLYTKGSRCCVIFVTAYDKYAIEAIKHAAFDYLMKPIDADELDLAVSKFICRKSIENRDEQIYKLLDKVTGEKKIKITTAGGFSLVHPDEILYIEADWNYSDIYFSGDRKEMVTSNIGNIFESLPKDQFFRISRSLIINTKYITKVNRKKRTVTLSREGKEYTFQIPVLNIRKLECFLEQ